MSSRYRQTFTHLLVRAESWLRNRNDRRRPYDRQIYRRAVLKGASPSFTVVPSPSFAQFELARTPLTDEVVELISS
uniref:Uncharacterized protein n=1 Tax=Panagrolaimus davidi TaxID=227884 RepID=A0A914QS59_9BILA